MAARALSADWKRIFTQRAKPAKVKPTGDRRIPVLQDFKSSSNLSVRNDALYSITARLSVLLFNGVIIQPHKKARLFKGFSQYVLFVHR